MRNKPVILCYEDQVNHHHTFKLNHQSVGKFLFCFLNEIFDIMSFSLSVPSYVNNPELEHERQIALVERKEKLVLILYSR